MPEGPEIHLASLFINKTCKDLTFSGKVIKNPIHKCPDIVCEVKSYNIVSQPRGKELMLHLTENMANAVDENKSQIKIQNAVQRLSLIFTFGMSGKFEFTAVNDRPKHSHLSFITKDEKMALSFVDPRRFGKWIVTDKWSSERGPCVINECVEFVKNVSDNLDNNAFKKPICEVLLNQKYFNGIGNYLRAEILFRCKIAPFERASDVLKVKIDDCKSSSPERKDENQTKKNTIKSEENMQVTDKNIVAQDNYEIKDDLMLNEFFMKFHPKAQELLRLCHTVPLEVVILGSSKYTLANLFSEDDSDAGSAFNDWLQCYYKPGMKNMADNNKRTIWFSGPVGPLAPKSQKPRVLIKSPKTKKNTSPKKDKHNCKDKSKKLSEERKNGQSEIDIPSLEVDESVDQKPGFKRKLSRNKSDSTNAQVLQKNKLLAEPSSKLVKQEQVENHVTKICVKNREIKKRTSNRLAQKLKK